MCVFARGGFVEHNDGGRRRRGGMSGSAENSDAELAVSCQGDVQITLTVTGGQDPAGTRLRDLLDAQYQRLATSR